MPLAAGMKLGPYEVVAPLGAGGMGEVYRARDSRLNRDVAVKVLPQHLSTDPDVRARFEREAKAVAALNHSSICAIYDVGSHAGVDYLVMELLEGETLADRLARGPLPLPELLRVGAQVADALDKAHRKGFVHRDLKPGNVMLTKSGAKLMDFGLARVTGLGPVSQLTSSPTATRPLTAEGTIVGTFHYMSPEQLEGREADARSDIWALGVTLYEMATGRRAFSGTSQASLITAIMASEPAPIAASDPMSPAALDRLVRGCLAKDPAERLQSAHDIGKALQWLAEPGSQAGAALPAPGPGARLARRPAFAIASLAVGVLGLAALAVAAWVLMARRTPVMLLQVPVPGDLRLSEMWTGHALSPDGGAVLSVGGRGSEVYRVWLSKLDSHEPEPLPGTEDGWFPSWSPDGRSFVFFRLEERGLYRSLVSGGTPMRLAEAPWGRGASWGSKGTIVFAPAASGPLLRIPAAGGVPVQVTQLDSTRRQASHRYPCFLPDGEHFLFAALPAGPSGFEIFAGSLSSRSVRKVMDADCAPVYARPGYLVFVKDGKVLAQRFDSRRMELVGERFSIADAPAASDLTAEPVASASIDGRLLLPSIPAPLSRLEWLDRSGASRGTIALPEGDWNLAALSPGARAALVSGGGDLWRVELDRAIATRLAKGVRPELSAAWSPDGRRFAMDVERQGGPRIQIYESGGGDAVDSVRTVDALFQEVADWAPDGRSLLVAAITRSANEAHATGWDLWTVPLDGSAAPRPYLRTPIFERFARISPDGNWVACEVRDRGQQRIFVDSYPVPGRRLQIASGANVGWVMWGRQGSELLYQDDAGDLVSVSLRLAGGELVPALPARLFRLPRGLAGIETADGERFLVSQPSGVGAAVSLRLLFGWTGAQGR